MVIQQLAIDHHPDRKLLLFNEWLRSMHNISFRQYLKLKVLNPMKVAILAGGLGSRLAEETETRPKPMVEVGGKPILWHIMKHYGAYNF